MDRVYESGASGVAPTPPAVPSTGYPSRGNPGTGTMPTVPGPYMMHSLVEEIMAVISAAAIAPDKVVLNQLKQALDTIYMSKNGTSALLQNFAGLTRSMTALGGGLVREYVDITNAATVGGIEIGVVYNCAINTATGVWAGRDIADICWLEKWHDVAGTKEFWFAPTGAANAVPVWVNVFTLNTTTGDLSISGKMTSAPATLATHLMTLGQADAKYLSNSGGDSRYGSSFLSVDGTVAANALTAVLNPCKLDFRAATMTNGTPNNRTVPAAISLVVPAGATLGTIAAQSARLVLLAIDNAGTVELAISNLAGGLNLDETTLVTTTAISAAATAANVIYSTTARAGMPFRIVGFLDVTEAVAGTWAVAPTVKQGIGGQALAAMGSLGYGQAWQNVTASRALATTYYNTTGRVIVVSFFGTNSILNGTAAFVVNGANVGISSGAAAAGGGVSGAFIVPPGAAYSIINFGNINTLSAWNELR